MRKHVGLYALFGILFLYACQVFSASALAETGSIWQFVKNEGQKGGAIGFKDNASSDEFAGPVFSCGANQNVMSVSVDLEPPVQSGQSIKVRLSKGTESLAIAGQTQDGLAGANLSQDVPREAAIKFLAAPGKLTLHVKKHKQVYYVGKSEAAFAEFMKACGGNEAEVTPAKETAATTAKEMPAKASSPSGQLSAIDVRGLYPGMPATKVLSFMKEMPGGLNQWEAKSNDGSIYHWYLVSGYLVKGQNFTRSKDKIYAFVSDPAVGSELLAVNRSVSYFPEQMPNRSQFLSNIISKFGEPSWTYRNDGKSYNTAPGDGEIFRLRWVFIDGKKMPLAKDSGCMVSMGMLPKFSGPVDGMNSFLQEDRAKTTEDWMRAFYQKGLDGVSCGLVVTVEVGSKKPNDKLSSFDMSIVDYPRIVKAQKAIEEDRKRRADDVYAKPYGAQPKL